MRWPLLFLASALLSCGACGGETPPPGPPAPPAPPRPLASSSASATPPAAQRREPVVVAVVIDQFSAWVADSRLPLLPADANGGLTRLVREGTWAKKLTYPYAVTDTAPGHAALHTGKLPSESGLFANELPDPNGPRRISVLRDPAVKLVLPSGPKDAPSSSPARLRADTVADRLRAARPDALVVSVSLKDRGAIVPGGKKPSHALWFDTGEASFVTSTAFAKSFPAWAKGVGDSPAIKQLLSLPWQPLDASWLARSSGMRDDEPGEGDLDGFGTTFPHVANSNAAFRSLPASDKTIANLALAAVKAEWDPRQPALVLLSFSANDVVGHTFGPDSWEAWDLLRRLDATLGDFLDALEKHVGPVSVVLSADHGNVPMPEARKSRAAHCECKEGERLSPQAMTTELRAAVTKALGGAATDFVAGVADPYVFLTPAARALPEAKRATLDRAVRASVAKHKGVVQVFEAKALAERCPDALAQKGDDDFTLVCRSWPAGAPADTGAGDYYLLAARGSFFDAEIATGKGTSHGTPYLYDRTVPLFVRTADKRDAGAVIEQRIDFTAYSAIEASLLGLDPRSPKDILAAAKR